MPSQRTDQRVSRRTDGHAQHRTDQRTGPDTGPGEGRATTPAARSLRELARRVRSCASCSLHAERANPVVGSGPADARLMLVGLAPTRHEDLQGLPFAGSSRNVLDTALHASGIDPREVRFTALVRCRPPDDRAPSLDEALTCATHLHTELDLVAPEVVVSFGEEVTSMLLGRPVPFERVAGYRLDIHQGTTLIPTFPPATAVRAGGDAAALRQHLAVARAVLDGRLGTGAQARADLRSRVASDR